MAKRPIFIPSTKAPFFEKQEVDFQWHPGFSLSQKQKSVSSLHQSASESLQVSNTLEVSTKSPTKLGNQLSAFNLPGFTTDKDYSSVREFSLETIFQTSKVFSPNISCKDLIRLEELEIRKEIRKRQKKNLSHFELEDEVWELQPVGAFYNYLYLRSLVQFEEFIDALIQHDSFTDIAFNPETSFNCQAESVSQLVGLIKAGVNTQKVLSSKKNFLKLVYDEESNTSVKSEINDQLELF